MRAYDIILKKRNGGELNPKEIEFLVLGYTEGRIPDYQMAAFTMAVFFKGMSERETLDLTMTMMDSGETISLKEIPGIKVDKHSTGGVGDTTTLVLAPLVAAAGVPVAKMSGRGLGHTGGTIDKFESIPGFKTDLPVNEMIEAVKSIGVAVVGQSGNLVPADKKLYALRDVTATVDSLPLIAASIMSKKLAAGADALVLDVKAGDGAFLKKIDDAFALASMMVQIGEGAGRETKAVITNMDQPLGKAVGNALEIKEAIHTLRGEGPQDLEELCLELGSRMLLLANNVKSIEKGKEKLKMLIEDGKALSKFKEFILNQHGNPQVVEDLTLLPQAKEKVPVKALKSGYVHGIKTESIGLGAMMLGAGRETKDALIDLSVGITVEKKVGDRVDEGDDLAFIYANSERNSEIANEVMKVVSKAYDIKTEFIERPKLVIGYVDKQGITRLT